jgi:NTE family protein
MKFTPKRSSAESPEVSGAADTEPTSSSPVKTINLALQGGGAHGAFTWGALDRLLDEKALAFAEAATRELPLNRMSRRLNPPPVGST